jgi:alpha-mannosidase
MIGNAHLDPVWLWQWPEGFQAAKATFQSVLQRMDESEDFVFTSSSAAIYEWVEQNEPRLFEAIKQRIAEGRWHIAGGWWLQPDCNLPSGESFVRQGLYGQRYFKEKFGVTARVGYCVDSFGHQGMLPQILAKSGMPFYVFTRPETHERGLPGRIFWWESDDGSRVLAYRIPFEYLSWGKDLERYVRRCMPELKDPVNELMCFYGVGNHGGGPTKENIESIRRLDADPAFPHLIFSNPLQFFESVSGGEHTFPTIHEDLQHHASGCYSAHSGIKRWNRQAEHLLGAAETFSALAERITGQPYPSSFARAWKNVLFNQFHDILAGTSLPAAYDDARDLHGAAMTIGSEALNNAIQSLAWQIDIPQQEGMTPIVVFNPHSWESTTNVELEYGGWKEEDSLLDDEGREIPKQFVRPSVVASGWRKRLSFVATLPPLGYRVYRMVREPSKIAAEPLAASDHAMENAWFRLEIDPATGNIASLWDKTEQVEVFAWSAARGVVIEDRSDTWGHGVYHFHDDVGAFSATQVRLLEHGPVKSVIRVRGAYGNSSLVQDFAMYRDLRQIDVQVKLDWREQWKMLKLRFPVNLNFIQATYEIPYGHIERPTNGEEEPGLRWLDCSGISRTNEIPYGLSILNDGKYSFDVKGREMSVTVTRSPIYAHHLPAQPQPDEEYTFIDQGIQYFNYTLLPHSGSWESAGTVRRAAELNQRPITLVESYHNGTLPLQASYLRVDQANVVVSAIKQAEDNDDTIIRCYETDQVATNATIHLPAWDRVIQASFAPCEIKTFRIPRDAALPVSETNLLEWPLP